MLHVTQSIVEPDLIDAIVTELQASIREMRCGSTERMVHQNLSMTHVHVLWLLEHHGAMPMSRLADLMDVSLSNATGLVDRMEERGLVERFRVPEDRRVVLRRLEPAQLAGALTAFRDIRTAIAAESGTAGGHHHHHFVDSAD
jgi:DNA-binding MarR family transcriptional regulator